MPVRILKIGLTLAGFITMVIGLGGTPEDIAGWQDWLKLLRNLLFPDVLRTGLILGGIAVIIVVNVPGLKWIQAGGGLRQLLRGHQAAFHIGCLVCRNIGSVPTQGWRFYRAAITRWKTTAITGNHAPT